MQSSRFRQQVPSQPRTDWENACAWDLILWDDVVTMYREITRWGRRYPPLVEDQELFWVQVFTTLGLWLAAPCPGDCQCGLLSI